jgi:hypothetical protein
MNARFQPTLGQALRHWRLRQKADGRLLRVLVLSSLFPLAGFFAYPSAGSALVMGFFLGALFVACLRLLVSAAKVAEIDRQIHPVPEIIDAEELDFADLQVYEPVRGLNNEPALLPSIRLSRDESGFN